MDHRAGLRWEAVAVARSLLSLAWILGIWACCALLHFSSRSTLTCILLLAAFCLLLCISKRLRLSILSSHQGLSSVSACPWISECGILVSHFSGPPFPHVRSGSLSPGAWRAAFEMRKLAANCNWSCKYLLLSVS